MPKNDQKVKTPDGNGVVVSVNLLRGIVKVAVEEEGEITLREYKASEIKLIKSKKHQEKE